MNVSDCKACADGQSHPPLRHSFIHRLLAPWLHLAGVSCRYFIDLASVRLDRPLTLGEKLRYYFHWIICRYCRLAGSQYAMLINLVRECDEVSAVSLSREALQRFSKALDQEGK